LGTDLEKCFPKKRFKLLTISGGLFGGGCGSCCGSLLCYKQELQALDFLFSIGGDGGGLFGGDGGNGIDIRL
jgi:hypothetical protein